MFTECSPVHRDVSNFIYPSSESAVQRHFKVLILWMVDMDGLASHNVKCDHLRHFWEKVELVRTFFITTTSASLAIHSPHPRHRR
jgi:hypothetical protein